MCCWITRNLAFLTTACMLLPRVAESASPSIEWTLSRSYSPGFNYPFPYWTSEAPFADASIRKGGYWKIEGEFKGKSGDGCFSPALATDTQSLYDGPARNGSPSSRLRIRIMYDPDEDGSAFFVEPQIETFNEVTGAGIVLVQGRGPEFDGLELHSIRLERHQDTIKFWFDGEFQWERALAENACWKSGDYSLYNEWSWLGAGWSGTVGEPGRLHSRQNFDLYNWNFYDGAERETRAGSEWERYR
jgi:hypothetical protein